MARTSPAATTMRLGLLGGTFDPIHYGHLMLAECCREQCRLERVFFLPAAVPPHKQGRPVTSAEHRVAMIEAALQDQASFAVSRYEVDRGGINYSVHTLEHFHQEFPQGEFFFIMGADMLLDLPNWREAGRVCSLATPAVARRAGTSPLDFNPLCTIASPERIEQMRLYQVEMPEIGISSSEIRRRVAAGSSIRYWTPPAVDQYICTHGLYRQG
jgi:nicotinate-nucleotide adenylyltransferase